MISSALAEEVVLHPDGVNADAGWALNRVGQGFSAASTYCYPATTTPVRLYLIDTAVSNAQSFVDANPNLTFEGPYLIRGANDPNVSTPRAHGTQLLSLISGIETGVAPGTPIHVVNYDIYPSATTTISQLGLAVLQAVQHHRDAEGADMMRSVICIATSSAATAAESAILTNAINSALSAGIPVVLSAGNINQDASGIVPSSHGIKNGVICVGASDLGDFKFAESNFGVPVDLFAPGVDVRTRSESATSDFVSMNGTSPAAALVTGAVLAKLSASPTHTPAGIESSLKAAAEISAAGLRLLRSIVPPDNTFTAPDVAPDGLVTPETISLTWELQSASNGLPIPIPASNLEATLPLPAPDTNSEGVPDILGIFHGTPQEMPQGPEISLSDDQKIQFKFSIASDLFDGDNPFVLRNGYTWQIRCSSGLSSWVVPKGELMKSTTNGRAYLTASFPADGPSCFARIEVVSPSP
ncbi:MAG: S8 family serine peptidase [Luteolibacter sp.]